MKAYKEVNTTNQETRLEIAQITERQRVLLLAIFGASTEGVRDFINSTLENTKIHIPLGQHYAAEYDEVKDLIDTIFTAL